MTYQRLAIPGPTPLPYEVLIAMDRQPIDHRGPEFVELLRSIEEKLQLVFQTHNPVYIFTCSGTGVMEATAANFFRPGDKVLALINGYFGKRFAEICECYDLEVERMEFKWGKPVSVIDVEDRLRADKNMEIKGVLFQLNETSTGVLNSAKDILDVIREHGAISVVDVISGLIAAPFHQDLWGADVVLGASQKGFMAPAGVAFISVSDSARQAITRPRSIYFSIPKAEECRKIGQTYATPAVIDMFGLNAGLDMILEEGLENCWARHKGLSAIVRDNVRNNGVNYGLKLLAANRYASPAVTAVEAPEWLNVAEFRKYLR